MARLIIRLDPSLLAGARIAIGDLNIELFTPTGLEQRRWALAGASD